VCHDLDLERHGQREGLKRLRRTHGSLHGAYCRGRHTLTGADGRPDGRHSGTLRGIGVPDRRDILQPAQLSNRHRHVEAYGQYQDYQSFGLDVGFRRYANGLDAKLRPYAEGTVGLGFVDETDIVLVAPTANLAGNATDFDDRTTALTLGANAGLLWQLAERFGVFGQLGVRWVSGMSEVDGLQGTGLETINDKSARWTLSFLVGVRARF
jgi:opacity protein-like surface antigen